ncbi:MAG TPA: hypothetical protein VMW45_00440 [Dehalococcoidia bacterium]|nr:hypothetical protein [Dehalococcoidia bacterium]
MSEKVRKKAMISYEELIPGYEFPPASYELSPSLISKYVEAVDCADELKVLGGFVPPLAIAAYAMATMTGSLSLPPGTIHASQEFEFFKLVPIGATINCQAKVARKLARATIHMLVLELDVLDQSSERVQSGKATIVLPV